MRRSLLADDRIDRRSVILKRLFRSPAQAAKHRERRAARRVDRLAVQIATDRQGTLPIRLLFTLAAIDVADPGTVVVTRGDRQEQCFGSGAQWAAAGSDHPDQRTVVWPRCGVRVRDRELALVHI